MKDRTQEMRDMYLADGLTMSEIAMKFSLSRQRVSQLIGTQGSDAHYGKAKKKALRKIYEDAHTRICTGVSTLEGEANALGITTKSLKSRISRCGLRLPGPPESPLHGTYYRYSRGCRCDECRQANREYVAILRARGAPSHGTESSYRNYACRCDACRKAGSEANRRYRLRRKLRDKERMPDE